MEKQDQRTACQATSMVTGTLYHLRPLLTKPTLLALSSTYSGTTRQEALSMSGPGPGVYGLRPRLRSRQDPQLLDLPLVASTTQPRSAITMPLASCG